MAATPEIRAHEGFWEIVLKENVQIDASYGSWDVIHRLATIQMNAPYGAYDVVYNVPAMTIRSSQANYEVVHKDVVAVDVPQASYDVVWRGKIDNPKLRAWAFTLDGHDFYVLRLGTGDKTLLLDLSTNQWSWWSSPDDVRWRGATGLNWASSDTISQIYGSNVIVGDDTTGALWVLDPQKADDDNVFSGIEAAGFQRTATAQLTTRARGFVPIYQVYLTAVRSNPLVPTTISLSYSDDQGKTYVNAGTLNVTADEDGEYAWRSLGLVKNPGRIFRVEDTGAFARIDGLEVSSGAAS